MKKRITIILIVMAVCLTGYYIFKTQILLTDNNAENKLKAYVNKKYSALEYEFGSFEYRVPHAGFEYPAEYVLEVNLKDKEGKSFSVYGHGITIYDNYDHQVLGI